MGAGLEMDDVPKPQPGSGQVLLKVHACGVNFADTLIVRGRYQEKPPLPFAPGMEVCGTVEALGHSLLYAAPDRIRRGVQKRVSARRAVRSAIKMQRAGPAPTVAQARCSRSEAEPIALMGRILG